MAVKNNSIMIDLIEKYGHTEIRDKFSQFKRNVTGFTDTNTVINLKTGDVVSFFGGYDGDIHFKSEILGFNNEGEAFVLWDCYWFAIELRERQFKKL